MDNFRVWDEKGNLFLPPQTAGYITIDGKYFCGFAAEHTSDKNNFTIQRSTKLLAKNGEIYEGDIVRFVQKDGDEIIFQDIGIVKWKNAAFIVDGSNWGKDDHYLGDYVVDGNLTELEIIGNIMENPEIIQKNEYTIN